MYETSSVDPDEISNLSFSVIGLIIVFILFCICLFALIFLLCKNKHRGVSSSTQSSQEEMSGEIMSSNSEIDLPQPSTLNPSLITEISLDPFQLPEDEPTS